jgi:ribosomal protein S27AE
MALNKLNEVYQVPQGHKRFKKWKCPKCGFEFKNPIAAFAVDCGRNNTHPREKVAMKPVGEPE